MTFGPTLKQIQILAFVRDHIETHGYAPSVRQIAEHFEISSTNGAASHLKAMERHRLIDRDAKVARSIRLTDNGRAWLASVEAA